MKKYLLLFLAGMSLAQACPGQVKTGADPSIRFASIEEARKILMAEDDYVRRMSPFDRAAKLKTDRETSTREYLERVGANVLAWEKAEREKIRSVFDGLKDRLEELSVPLPEKIYFIKTNGKDEGNAAYTRANAIILPKGRLAASSGNLRSLLSHELFHVMSRSRPALADQLYAAIGFERCEEPEFPDELKARKITNPDAPANDHCIRIELDGEAHWAIPIIFSSAEHYDVAQGGTFFKYLQFRFLLVEREGDSPKVNPIREGGVAKLVKLDEVSGFYEQVGRNTGYILHPEETLADNFALLVTGGKKVKSPEVLREMERLLKAWKAGGTVRRGDSRSLIED